MYSTYSLAFTGSFPFWMQHSRLWIYRTASPPPQWHSLLLQVEAFSSRSSLGRTIVINKKLFWLGEIQRTEDAPVFHHLPIGYRGNPRRCLFWYYVTQWYTPYRVPKRTPYTSVVQDGTRWNKITLVIYLKGYRSKRGRFYTAYDEDVSTHGWSLYCVKWPFAGTPRSNPLKYIYASLGIIVYGKQKSIY